MKGRKFFAVLVVITIVLASFSAVALIKEGLEFKKMVLDHADAIIEDAVGDIARNLKYMEVVGFLNTAGSNVRSAVWASVAKEINPNNIYYWQVLNGDDYDFCRNIARRALKTSTGLKTVYSTLKPKVIEEIKKNGIEWKIKKQLNWLLPFFNGTLHEDRVEKLHTYYLVSKTASYRISYELEREFQEEYGIEVKEFYTYEWVLRRKNEGGQSLIGTYAWCIQDMINSL